MTAPCGRPVGDDELCSLPCSKWRQCPIRGCGFEIARCDGHGGDARAVELMFDHIRGHVGVATSDPA